MKVIIIALIIALPSIASAQFDDETVQLFYDNMVHELGAVHMYYERDKDNDMNGVMLVSNMSPRLLMGYIQSYWEEEFIDFEIATDWEVYKSMFYAYALVDGETVLISLFQERNVIIICHITK